MKMDKDTFAYLERCIKAYMAENDGLHLTADSYRRHGLSETRWRWDLFYASGHYENRQTGAHNDTTGTIKRFWDYFSDLDDSHIDTALRRIVSALASYGLEAA